MTYKTQKTKQDLKESEEALQFVMANIQRHISTGPEAQVILERIEKDIRLYGDICNVEGRVTEFLEEVGERNLTMLQRDFDNVKSGKMSCKEIANKIRKEYNEW
jgi:hypothetical protein|nr:MAG TPA: hypothetical protein [Caudoviricetes sp.]